MEAVQSPLGLQHLRLDSIPRIAASRPPLQIRRCPASRCAHPHERRLPVSLQVSPRPPPSAARHNIRESPSTKSYLDPASTSRHPRRMPAACVFNYFILRIRFPAVDRLSRPPTATDLRRLSPRLQRRPYKRPSPTVPPSGKAAQIRQSGG